MTYVRGGVIVAGVVAMLAVLSCVWLEHVHILQSNAATATAAAAKIVSRLDSLDNKLDKLAAALEVLAAGSVAARVARPDRDGLDDVAPGAAAPAAGAVKAKDTTTQKAQQHKKPKRKLISAAAGDPGDCVVLPAHGSRGHWQAALSGGEPVIAPLAALLQQTDPVAATDGELDFWSLFPDDALFDFSVSPDRGFYGQVVWRTGYDS
jgi:hypothetical protein